VRAAGLIAAVALSAAAVTGCASAPAATRGSVAACTQFGIEAIRHHITVTARPPACQGLSKRQVNLAVSGALRSVAVGAHGKARQRARIAAASRYLQHLVTAPPAPPSPQVTAPAGNQAARPVLGLIAVCSWLVTAGLGLSVMAGWVRRGRRRRVPAGQPPDPAAQPRAPADRLWRIPARNAAHLGLALTGLLTWVAYLVTGEIGVAWAACALLLPAIGLGMTLVFLAPPRAGRRPVLIVGAHIAFATVTILFALLTAVGGG
jgi:hypothetical protein